MRQAGICSRALPTAKGVSAWLFPPTALVSHDPPRLVSALSGQLPEDTRFLEHTLYGLWADLERFGGERDRDQRRERMRLTKSGSREVESHAFSFSLNCS